MGDGRQGHLRLVLLLLSFLVEVLAVEATKNFFTGFAQFGVCSKLDESSSRNLRTFRSQICRLQICSQAPWSLESKPFGCKMLAELCSWKRRSPKPFTRWVEFQCWKHRTSQNYIYSVAWKSDSALLSATIRNIHNVPRWNLWAWLQILWTNPWYKVEQSRFTNIATMPQDFWNRTETGFYPRNPSRCPSLVVTPEASHGVTGHFW